jgi:hypothetical protein
MEDYDPLFKALSKKYVRAHMEHKQATEIATKELKPFKVRLDRQKHEIDNVFGQKKWTCVKDPISGLYVTRLRVTTPKPLTLELMKEILTRVESLDHAKRNTWKDVKSAIVETIDLIHSMRLQDKFTVSVKSKPPTTKTKVVHMKAEGMGEYEAWLHAFVAAHGNLKQKEDGVKNKKKVLKARFDDIGAEVEGYYKKNDYVSIPIKLERKISPEFQDVVVMTGSNYLNQKLPRKTKRYLEYIPVTKRNTTVKKFSPGKKEVTAYLTEQARKYTRLRDLDLKHLVHTMFKDLQTKASKANEEKLRKAKANPEFKLKVSQKKTMSKHKKKSSNPPKPPKRKASSSSSNVVYKRNR